MDRFIYLIIRNVDLFIYCPLIFCTYLLLVVRQISQLIHCMPSGQAASKNLWEKRCAYTMLSEKGGLPHRNPEKLGHSYTFCWKKGGPIIYLAALKKGDVRHAHRYFAISYIGSYPPSPPPPPPTHTHKLNNQTRLHFPYYSVTIPWLKCNWSVIKMNIFLFSAQKKNLSWRMRKKKSQWILLKNWFI